MDQISQNVLKPETNFFQGSVAAVCRGGGHANNRCVPNFFSARYTMCQKLLKSVNVCRNYNDINMWTLFWYTVYYSFPLVSAITLQIGCVHRSSFLSRSGDITCPASDFYRSLSKPSMVNKYQVHYSADKTVLCSQSIIRYCPHAITYYINFIQSSKGGLATVVPLMGMNDQYFSRFSDASAVPTLNKCRSIATTE